MVIRRPGRDGGGAGTSPGRITRRECGLDEGSRRKYIDTPPSSTALTICALPSRISIFSRALMIRRMIRGPYCGERSSLASGLTRANRLIDLLIVKCVQARKLVAKFWAYGSGFDSVDDPVQSVITAGLSDIFGDTSRMFHGQFILMPKCFLRDSHSVPTRTTSIHRQDFKRLGKG